MADWFLDDYVPVNERLVLFRADHPDWSLICHLSFDGDAILARAEIADETGRIIAVGHAEEIRDKTPVNKTSAVENAETSAWGRALASLGYEVKRGIASREEMEKVSRSQGRAQPRTRGSAKENGPGAGTTRTATPDQALAIHASELGISEQDRKDVLRAITKGRTDSGKDLEPHERIWAATAYEDIARDEVRIVRDRDGVVRLVKVKVPAGNNPGPLGDEPF